MYQRLDLRSVVRTHVNIAQEIHESAMLVLAAIFGIADSAEATGHSITVVALIATWVYVGEYALRTYWALEIVFDILEDVLDRIQDARDLSLCGRIIHTEPLGEILRAGRMM